MKTKSVTDYIEVRTPIDDKGSPYGEYRGRSIGRVLHYIDVICGLRYAESVVVCGDGTIVYYGALFARVDWDRGYPHFCFVDETWNRRQEEELESNRKLEI